jgi:hypothetical protein
LIQSTAIEAFADSPALGSVEIYPNPAASRVRFEISLELPADVEVRVVDILGRQVAQPFMASYQSAGLLDVAWDATTAGGQRVAPGVYQVVIRAGRSRTVRSLVILP